MTAHAHALAYTDTHAHAHAHVYTHAHAHAHVNGHASVRAHARTDYYMDADVVAGIVDCDWCDVPAADTFCDGCAVTVPAADILETRLVVTL